MEIGDIERLYTDCTGDVEYSRQVATKVQRNRQLAKIEANGYGKG